MSISSHLNLWAEIKKENFIHNCNIVKKITGNNVKILAAVKANGYGHGITETSNILLSAGVDMLGVANTEEGIILRKDGIKAPILLLGYLFEQEIPSVLEYNLTPSINNISLAEQLNLEASKRNIKKHIHINVDTGIGRMGIQYNTAIDFIHKIGNMNNIEIEGLYTHLSVSDEKENSFNKKQIDLFNRICENLEKDGFRIPIYHTANSGAVINFRESFFNMVRPGIMLYGYYPDTGIKKDINLKPVIEVKSKICFIKKVPAGTTLGYGNTYTTDKEQTIAVVPIGYADGYRRDFSNKGYMLVNNKFCKVRGRVSMDQTLIDISEAQDVKIGTEVIVFSNNREHKNSIENSAKIINTIPYELTCGLGERIHRVYY